MEKQRLGGQFKLDSKRTTQYNEIIDKDNLTPLEIANGNDFQS
jgi:hypothetical protein